MANSLLSYFDLKPPDFLYLCLGCCRCMETSDSSSTFMLSDFKLPVQVHGLMGVAASTEIIPVLSIIFIIGTRGKSS